MVGGDARKAEEQAEVEEVAPHGGELGGMPSMRGAADGVEADADTGEEGKKSDGILDFLPL